MKRRPLASLALAAASALVTLALGEVAVRALGLGPVIRVENRWHYQASDDPELRYELRPGAPDGVFWFSDAGLRDADVPLEKPPGVFRIAAIGDSVAFGMGLGRNQSFVERLEQLLNRYAAKGAPRFEVLNLGVPGYNISQIAERLRVLGLRFEPDLIVYGYVLNDPQEFSLEGDAIERRLERESRRRQTLGPDSALRWLAHSRLFLLAWARITGMRGARGGKAERPDPQYLPGEDERVGYFRGLHAGGAPARRFARGMARLAELARGARVPLLVAIFPLFLDGEASPPDVHRRVAAEAERDGLRALDLAPVFESARARLGEGLEIDFLHPNALGHRVAAHALLAWLCAERALPEGSVDCGERLRGGDPDARIARAVARGPA